MVNKPAVIFTGTAGAPKFRLTVDDSDLCELALRLPAKARKTPEAFREIVRRIKEREDLL